MKRLHLIFIVFLSFCYTLTYSQNEANTWYFGEGAGLDFNTNPPTALTDGRLTTDEGCSSFSDADGNLLFYSDGISVYNKNHELMTYTGGRLANDLEGNPSSTQSGMIIPKPGSTTIYYLFTVGTDFVPDEVDPNPGFNYYTIDMSLNNGLGEITAGPINLATNPNTNQDLSNDWSEKVAAVKGADCNTFWVLSFVTNTFYAYKVNENGVDVNNVVISQVNYTAIDKRGYLQVSPDGEKIAFADYNSNFRDNIINGSLLLFDFNDETGVVGTTPEVLIRPNTGLSPYGVSFSQQSNKLYASFFDSDFSVFQFDLESTTNDIALIASRPGDFRGALQLGPDGKIYVSIPNSDYLDVIENPNEDADNVIYSEDAIFLNGKQTTQGLPPFIASLLLPIEISETVDNEIINNQDLQYCIGESLIIEPELITGTNITYSWTFNNGVTTTNLSNTATLNLTNLTTTNDGVYDLIISLEDTCSNAVTFEATFNLEVFEPAIANSINDLNICSIDGIETFDLETNISSQALGNQDPNQFEVIYFLTENDAINNSNSIINPYEFSDFISQDFYARVHNIDAPTACFDITSFNITISQIPQPTELSNYIVCDDIISGSDTDGIFNSFILSTKDDEILGGLDPLEYNISYYTNLSDAQTNNITNAIDKNSPFTNTTTNEQTIYFRVENINNTNCFIVSEENSDILPFSLIVNSLPTITSFYQSTQCDVDNDLTTNIDLTLNEINLSSDYINQRFSYYPSESDAIADTREISIPSNHTISNGDSVWVRVIAENDCHRIAELNFNVSFSGSLNYNETFLGCDDEFDSEGNDSELDGITNFDFSSVTTDILNLFDPSLQNDLDVLIFETEADRQTSQNQIANLTTYRNTNIPAFSPQNLYVKVININNNDCVGLADFTITVNPTPDFTITTPQIFCSNQSPLTIEIENPDGIYSYEWTKDDNPSIIGQSTSLDITAAGAYHVTAINTTTLCSLTKTIITNESEIAANVNEDTFTIIDDANNNSITINEESLGSGDYEYALFNQDQSELLVNYQDEPFFDNLIGGVYTIAIQDKNDCGIITYQISIIEFPKFITPNDPDGFNDTFTIKGVDNTLYTNSTIYIFDRYGKQLAEIPFGGEGWDGTYNGKRLPENDYWYSVQLIDINGNIRNKKGHFSLLRN